jgi:uncharacterized membrane protein YfhO
MKKTRVATRFDPTTDERYADILLLGKKQWNARQCVIFAITPIVSHVWFFTFACMQKYMKDIHICISSFSIMAWFFDPALESVSKWLFAAIVLVQPNVH